METEKYISSDGFSGTVPEFALKAACSVIIILKSKHLHHSLSVNTSLVELSLWVAYSITRCRLMLCIECLSRKYGIYRGKKQISALRRSGGPLGSPESLGLLHLKVGFSRLLLIVICARVVLHNIS